MLKIRLQRVGRKNNPSFRFVLTDSKNSTKSGKYLEVLGHHDFRNEFDNHIDVEKVKYWLSQGAKATPTVHNFLIEKKIITGKKINVLPRKSPPKKEEAPADAAKPADAPKEEKAPEAKETPKA